MSQILQTDYAKETIEIALSAEMKASYLDYAMSVIVGRALPDARDGLKPVHRRVLYAMHELGNTYNKPFKKSARIVGDTIGKYHPHGDTAVYDTIVRMAQKFSLRYPLIDGQGNFGSIDGDSAAAMRYTEIRLDKISDLMLADIEKNTVDFNSNYDGSESEPSVLPNRLPNFLLNGSEGIAVGMATKVPPHNLNELLDACLRLIDDANISIDELIEIVKAPDFPTGAYICGREGAVQAYKTGRGSVVMRAKTHFEEMERERFCIVVDELPYQVNKKVLQEKIAALVVDKQIEGISNIQDESDKSGIRLVIELKRGVVPDVVLNQLYKKTELQTSFGINCVALVEGKPCVLTLKDCLSIFLDHRKEIIFRKTLFELSQARQRAHILEGLAVALDNINEIVEIIKNAKDVQQARENLIAKKWDVQLIPTLRKVSDNYLTVPDNFIENFGLLESTDHRFQYQLSSLQVQDILQLRLSKLTGLEMEKIATDYKIILATILDLQNILSDEKRIRDIIKLELIESKGQFGDARKSEIIYTGFDIEDEDLIPRNDSILLLTKQGYIKNVQLDQFDIQNRGGRGRSGTDLKDEDAVIKSLQINSHDLVCFFTSMGRVFAKKGYQVPYSTRTSKGRPLVNYLQLQPGEMVVSILNINTELFERIEENEEKWFLILATKNGIIKRCSLDLFKSIRNNGLKAINLEDGDTLQASVLCDSSQNLLVFASKNHAVKFAIDDLRSLSRTARGVKAFKKVSADDNLVSVVAARDDDDVFVVTNTGIGKKVGVALFRQTSRGAKGVRPLPNKEDVGNLIAALNVSKAKSIVLNTNEGTILRLPIDQIRTLSRSAMGTKLIKLKDTQLVVGATLIESEELVEESAEEIMFVPEQDNNQGE